MDQTAVPGVDTRWLTLYRIGGVATVVMVALIPIQVLIFIAYPPPETVSEFFDLFQENAFLGLLSLDLLYILNNTLLSLIYLALYVALRRFNESLMAVALLLGVLGIAAYFASNTAFEMLSLSSQYAAATTEAGQASALAAGQAMLAIYTGTAFDVYYVLDAVVLLIIAWVMLRSPVFGRMTAYAGLVAGILMLVPSTVPTIGPLFALGSLLPWTLFSILIARRFFQLASTRE